MTRLSHEVRLKFVNYFTKKHGHQFIKSSSIRPPEDDRSTEFTSAGMQQFKKLFMSDKETFEPSRVCNYQKCIRVGGKMCDKHSVGLDFRHHTFFEMLGNWSFNDYGKQSACEWALDFLVNEVKLDKNKLVVTYHASDTEEDTETESIWLKLGLHKSQVLANDKGDNLWHTGTKGPCGLSTELFYPCGNELLEVWNLVFIDRKIVDENSYKTEPLRHAKFVDTGLGLERLMCLVENVTTNYETDLFKDLIIAVEKKAPDLPRYGGLLNDKLDISYRVLVDHCRMITMALADGVEPGRRGIEFELRSMIKKVTLLSRDVFKQVTPRYLIFDLVDSTIDILSPAYPELRSQVKSIRRVLAKETIRFVKYCNKREAQEASCS